MHLRSDERIGYHTQNKRYCRTAGRRDLMWTFSTALIHRPALNKRVCFSHSQFLAISIAVSFPFNSVDWAPLFPPTPFKACYR